MVSTPEGFTDNITTSPGPYVTVKKPSARKSLYQFTEFLDAKQKIVVRRLDASKSNIKSIIAGSMLWSSIPKRHEHTKINEQVKKLFVIGFYNILRLYKNPIANYFLKGSIYGNFETQLVKKILQVSVRELHNSMVIPPE